ncbi:MAG: ATP-binding protein [Nanoarchaeota archaeon]|nr:ATP-binding protein [Nanoarchaeota archaeon]
MDFESISEYLLDFNKRKLPDLIKRDLKIPDTKKIKTIIGPRRAGKTYFMFQKIKEMINSEIKKEEIIYLNFEDPRLIDLNFKEIKEIIKIQRRLFPKINKINLFIDEPQNIKNWEVAIRSLHDECYNIFLSGSNSKLLSKEIATSLRGRTITYLLLPFSFKEFLKIDNLNLDIKKLNSKEKAILMSYYDKYLEFGGFPEIIFEKDEENKLRIILEYFNMVVYKDIVERYKIKNNELIRWMIKSLINSFSKEFSVNKVYLTLKSQGIKLSKNTLYSYSSMLQDSMFVFFLDKFKKSIRKKELSISKAYLNDVVFSKIGESSKNLGRKMENIVFLELQQRKNPLSEISYWKNEQKQEVDFVIKETKVKQLIQICYDLKDLDTKKREIRALINAGKELKCKNLLIITHNKDGEEYYKNFKIKFIPLWKWLLKCRT